MHSQDKKLTFKSRLESGASVREASYAEGISTSTGYRWQHQLQVEELVAQLEEIKAANQKLQANHKEIQAHHKEIQADIEKMVHSHSLSRGRILAISHWLKTVAWRVLVNKDLDAQVAEGGEIYGYRRDGAYVVRTKNGDQVITHQGMRAASWIR